MGFVTTGLLIPMLVLRNAIVVTPVAHRIPWVRVYISCENLRPQLPGCAIVSAKPVHLHNVVCAVEPPANAFGEFANSFRYIVDGSEVLLDFCLFSERDQRARVVSRVRIPRELFPVISQRFTSGLAAMAEPDLTLFSTPAES